MSSLTTISGGAMEESQKVEELVDTRLSLVIGAASRPPPTVLALLPATSLENGAATRGKRKGVKGPENGAGGAAATSSREHSKRAKTVHDSSDVYDDGGDAARGGTRKKLRLTVEQAALLEESFRAHNVLSHGEKHDLARQLGLKPRQVEVWFQNRRARTKLKQTELDCELLRRWCERLSDDNARLRRELAETLSSSPAFLSRLTMANNKVVCSSCNKLTSARMPG